MKYVPIPIAMLEVGRPLPIDIWSDTGQLLLKKGQPVVSEQHRDKPNPTYIAAGNAAAECWILFLACTFKLCVGKRQLRFSNVQFWVMIQRT